MDEALIQRIRQDIQNGTKQPQQTTSPAPADGAPTSGIGQDLGDVAYDHREALATAKNVVVGGARDALQATWDTASAIGPAVSQFADRVGLNVLGLPTMEEGDKPTLPKVQRADENAPGGVAANVVRDLERFVLGFIGGGMALRGLGVATNTFRGATAAGALGDFLVTGADDKRFVDLFAAVPALQGSILEAMTTDGNDNLWAHKLAAAGEGMIFGGAIEGLTRFVGSLRKVRVAQETGDAKVIQQTVDEALPEMQASLKEIQGWHGERAEVIGADGITIKGRASLDVSPSGQIEMFPEVVRREEAIHDIQLQIKGDRYLDPETGKEKILPIGNRAREELTAAVKDPSSPLHIDKLTPETRDELLRALATDNEAARFFAPKTVRGRPFALDDTRRGDFDAALERSLTIPYATLRASNPGVALEDTLSTFFNYRYMDSADTVKGSLDQLAEVMKPMVDKHVGGFPQTFDQVREMADWLNMKPDTLTALLSQQARAAEYMPSLVVAGKTWIQSLTRDIHQISKSIAAGTATDTAKVELARRQDILADLIGTLKAVQTSSARTTSAGRIRTSDALTHEEIATLVSEIGEDSFKVLSRKLNLTDGNPKAIIALLEPGIGAKAMGVLNETWINGLLSGLGTHIVNFVGGTRNTLLYPSFRFVGGALTGDVRSMKIAMGQYAGLKDALFGSIEMAWRSLKTENSYVDASFHQIERERNWIKAETFGQNGGDTLGKAIDFLGTAVRMPGRFLTSSDEFLKQMNYRASVHARARVEAYERGLSDEKLVPYFVDGEKRMISEVDEYVLDRKNEAFHPRLEHGTDQAALRDARTATFTQPLKIDTFYRGPSLGEKLQQVAAQIPPVRHLVLPFVRVPVNIFREMIYESPAALGRTQFWVDIKAGGEARSDAVGRLAVGSLFWTGTAMLAAEGIITGKGPLDPVLQAQWKLDGKQPYSIKFPGAGPDGKDLWIDYSRLGDQWAGMLGIAADAAYIMAHVDERTRDQMAVTLSLSLANNLNSRGYLRSLTELSAALAATANPQGPGAVGRFLNSRAASYVPRIVDSMNPDDTMRDARDMIDSIYARIPGLSSTLEAKVDNFGVPMAPQVGWPINEINPFKLSLTKPGAARKELSYWADSPVRAQFEIPSSVIDGVIDLRHFRNADTGQTAWGRWMQLLTEPKFGGQSFEERMDEIASSDGYKALKDQGKEDPIFRRHPAVEFLRKQMGDHYEVAQKMMLAEPGFEELQAAMGAYEANKRAVPVGGERIADPALDELLKKRR